MKYINSKLSRQLFAVAVIISCVIFLFLGILLPKALLPIYEKNVYMYLEQPLNFLQPDIDPKFNKTEIAYLYVFGDQVIKSDNFDAIVGSDVNKVKDKIVGDKGSFRIKATKYYYYRVHDEENDITKIAITDDSYIESIRKDILYTILPVLFVAMGICALFLGGWAIYLVKRIERLKNKVDHFDDDRYDHQLKSASDDEISSLEEALEEMRILQKTQEESRNQMYQNTSHDLKTPIAVIKSYIEALEDDMEEEETVIQVIKEQTDKLEQKVRTLLYLNKLDYLKDENAIYNITFDITEILNSSIKKFKFQRKDLKFITRYDKDTIFRGSSELWEAIIDNLLNNFMRYAKTTVKITVKNGKITFFNDGEPIDEKIIDHMFSPYKKGLNGEFGLGLSIVKKTLRLLGYEISVKNTNSGVHFIIK